VRFEVPWRLDWEDPSTWRAVAWSLPLAALVGALTIGWMVRSGQTLAAPLLGIGTFCLTLAVSTGLSLGLAHGAGKGATSFLAPSGRGTPSVDEYSREKSLLARGRVDEALTALQVHLANRPGDPALCLLIADVYAHQAGQAAKAEGFYRRARESPVATPAHDYQATNRLIDLYLGPLDDARRAAAELERLRGRHAGTQGAAHAEAALRRLREG
jgi:hypothetical protein